MMRGAVVALTLLASPAAAFEAMNRSQCDAAWLAAVEQIFSMVPDMPVGVAQEAEAARGVRSDLTDDGWCRLVGGSPGLEKAHFATFDWQAEDIARYIDDGAPPLALRLRITDVYDDAGLAPRIDVNATLRQVPGSGLLLLETLEFADATGPYLAMSAVFGGAYLDSESSTLSSLGGITIQQMAARLNLTPDRNSDLNAPAVIGSLQDAVVDMLDGLDDAQLNDESRTALTALMNALPDATGTLEMNGKSERGLGWMQIGMAQAFNPDATTAEIIGFALSGVTVDATWTPVE